ncbi:NUMOD3 domain-containing DNA-binding protein, partial [Veillonella dispar]
MLWQFNFLETRRKMSEARKGRKPMLGKHHSA